MKRAVPFLLAACSCFSGISQVNNVQAPVTQAPLPMAAAESAPVKLDNAPSACPSDMVEVDGDYCPNEEQVCLYNTEIDGSRSKKPVSPLWACGEYRPGRCLSATVHLHFCIDRYEWPNKVGHKPQDWMTWYDAKHAVESVGKRLCTAHEWTLAAEGPHEHPLPYGDGYHRNGATCNFDNINPGIDVFKSRKPDDEASHSLRALLVESGSKPDCASDYGVHDMAGNIDEWVVNEHSNLLECPKEIAAQGKCKEVEYRSGLKGGHIWHVRNASRPMTVSHNASFGWYETGTRACKDIAP